MLMFMERLRDAPNHPGRWGKTLMLIIAAHWFGALCADAPSVHESEAFSTLMAVMGRPILAAWFGGLIFITVIGIGTGGTLLRGVGATIGMFTWSTLIGLAVWKGSSGWALEIGVYVALFLACAYADYRLAVGTAQLWKASQPAKS